ncbi:DNA mismatch repair protein [Vigna angularis]|uniref:DNA mismatch repair protein n=1 Tax=Phaseolus angularis TaxID=3914 RepID=A0A8T0LH27_PHAAN|nr:DNA mismatch repair protein [Vigna angularis]
MQLSSNVLVPLIKPPKSYFSFKLQSCSNPNSNSPESNSLQADTLKTLEWSSVCKQLSPFTSTSMGSAAALNARLPVGRTPRQSQKLLDQTSAARLLARPLDFSGIHDLTEILRVATSGQLLTIRELCTVRRTLVAARELFDSLKRFSSDSNHPQRNSKIIIRTVNFIDAIVSHQAGGIDKPLITKRRSRMCVGIRASHRYLLPGGVVLNVSSSGATYFMEPKDAIDLNNLEVRLSSSEKAEESAILSMLSSEIANSESVINNLLDKILEIDLAFARAAYAQWMNGVCPIFKLDSFEGCDSNDEDNDILDQQEDDSLNVNIVGIRHPLLLESSLDIISDNLALRSGNAAKFGDGNGAMATTYTSHSISDFPVPVDFKIGRGTRVVVISGPNTGGKTASMKTLGLASLMSKAGMHLPAKNNPKLPWFDLILADIGDHQSLEQNLSTFSGHISRICKILEVATTQSLVLIDEIGGGTDPSEGVALSASILQYLKDRVNLAVVTTHYADLSSLKEEDTCFDNAAMEFSLETLQPTYRILWGCTGDSNALSIAQSIGFDRNIIDRAQNWVEKFKPEQQQERRGLLYQSLQEERNRLKAQAGKAASIHAETMSVYNEIQGEAEDLDRREMELMAKETQQVQLELVNAKSQMETLIQKFEKQLKSSGRDKLNSLIKETESAIASIVKAHTPADHFNEADQTSYTPQIGEQVHVKGLGGKLATVVESLGDVETILVQYGKVKARVKKSNIVALPSNAKNAVTSSSVHQGRQSRRNAEYRVNVDIKSDDDISYGPVVRTSKNTVDLRGMRVEEASIHLEMAIDASRPYSVLFVIHGTGTGAVKERALEILQNHPRITNHEPESPMNYGCTIAYVNCGYASELRVPIQMCFCHDMPSCLREMICGSMVANPCDGGDRQETFWGLHLCGVGML